ncbi:putative Na+/H+ antiporter [Luteolibacter sp. GHJ8]|uniref:Na+/H+ antiporter n=1 Tax=Luteolibacter rhizosphaerae TaxID=2989719 RepID=A0ABT3FXS0_9BACT|nr:putative Na+/H+ antiporter [Luteolibacter rhizosphaerae]MCW1912367.1 putative Na+/H+ antiporter [Luteolibacter rhizosphaerae]
MRLFSIIFTLFVVLAPALSFAADAHAEPVFLEKMATFPQQEEAQGIKEIGAKLAFRAKEEPFLLVATIIFVLAILHTFVAVPITKLAHKVQHDHDERIRKVNSGSAKAHQMVSFKGTILHFLGEVEAIFGIWVLVLLTAMLSFYDLGTVKSYMMGVNFTEPLFVVIIMALASTRPVLRFAEGCLGFFARFGKESPAAWWLSILIMGPLLGSFITEPGAMTISAMLLAKKFYRLKPTPLFSYATLGLLFVNISVGGVLTNFAAPPVLMVAKSWGLSTTEMLLHYGDKAVVAILLSTALYYGLFRKELAAMAERAGDHDGDGKGDLRENPRPIPIFVILTHLAFMAWTVFFAHYPPLFIGGFLFFLAFSQATAHHQHEINLRGPILVGFFLAGLVVHGGLQGWWLAPIIGSLGKEALFVGSTILTSFNDNAAITFLASQVQGLPAQLKYAVLAGAVTGGGLTVIANAPNPAGQALLGRFFGEGVSPAKLFLGALIPTVIVAVCMLFFPDKGIDEMFAPEKEAGYSAPAETP